MTDHAIPDAVPLYAEDGCSRRWPFLVLGMGMPALVLLCSVFGVATADRKFALLAAVPVFVWIFTDACLLPQYWPVGIRIDGTGIRIGGLRRAERRCARKPETRTARRKLPPPPYQCYHVFSVPWAGVRSLTVITDQDELRRLRQQSRQGTLSGVKVRGLAIDFQLGMLVPPFIQAALVIDIDPQIADFPQFRVQQSFDWAPSQESTPSSTWVVPTRRLDQLHATVEQITNSTAWNTRYR
jgi:hypothetical protein